MTDSFAKSIRIAMEKAPIQNLVNLWDFLLLTRLDGDLKSGASMADLILTMGLTKKDLKYFFMLYQALI